MEHTTDLTAVNPRTNEALDGSFSVNTKKDISTVVEAAKNAFESYSLLEPKKRAEFLEAIGDEILLLGDELIDRASAESGLPPERIVGERGRTVNQLKLFAAHIREGSWVEASIDTAIPDRTPIPKPDIRKMLVPIGPVAVFTASNFPLAFSTAGGDTASALAAGNPVIVKGHNAHLGTNQLVTEAIQKACESQKLPKGVFQSVIGSDFSIGQELVRHPDVKAVGFTGSLSGGKALYDIAVNRDNPIPVFAEMSSINPVVLLPDAVVKRKNLAKELAGSITLGAGQFCTNPGLLIAIDSSALDSLCQSLKLEIEQSKGSTMLHQGIYKNYLEKYTAYCVQDGIELVGVSNDPGGNLKARSMIATTTGANFLTDPTLSEEVFGPYSLLVKCKDKKQLEDVLRKVKGQLTITFIAEETEILAYKSLVLLAQSNAGRVLFNGMPTGVEVCHSMVHGGPFPATTDSRTTSVGTDAIKRFVRPVCFQNTPSSLLPTDLQDRNPSSIWRTVNGELTRDSIS